MVKILIETKKIYLDLHIKSVKGITHRAQTEIKHQDFKEILATSEQRKLRNIIITTDRHALFTVEQNKVALSAFCNKRFYLDAYHSIPFGHKHIRELAFHNMILDDWDWDGENDDIVSSSGSEKEDYTSTDENEEGETPFLDNAVHSPTDPGFHQREYDTSELEDDIVDWNEPYTISPPSINNTFIDNEAQESGNDSLSNSPVLSQQPAKKRKRMLSFNSYDSD